MSIKAIARRLGRALRLLSSPATWKNLPWFLADYLELQRQYRADGDIARPALVMYPCLADRTAITPLEPTYFFQDTWAARNIFRNKPSAHYDIGSSAKTVGILSQFVPVTMIDIRPIDLALDGLHFKRGSILAIPEPDDSIQSLSSLCVLEHIGLGRYGDPVDIHGSRDAAKELQRVLAPGGHLYVSVPVDDACKLYFNAHRAFTRAAVLAMFDELALVEERYHYGRSMHDHYDPAKGFVTGLFHFTKPHRAGNGTSHIVSREPAE